MPLLLPNSQFFHEKNSKMAISSGNGHFIYLFIRLITFNGHFVIKWRLHKLQLMSLQRRRERFIIINMWKIFNGVSPNDLNLQKHVSQRRGIRAIVPPLSKTASTHAQSLYDHSFAVIGPRLWNTLPTKITTITSKTSFKTALSKHIAQIPDHPPVDGIASDNSLLDMNRRKMEMIGGPVSATDAQMASVR